MTKRQIGMDRLRILAACFVVGIHLFALLADLSGGPGLFPKLLTYALVFCAVNVFGLLSGFLGYREENNRIRLAALLTLWLQFVYYRVCFLLLPALLGLAEPVSLADIFLPVTRRVNWYMSAYFELMLLSPALNLVIARTSRRANAAACLGLLALSAGSTFLRAVMDCDPWLLGEGYNWMWLGCLYFWGASLRKHGWLFDAKRRRLWLALGSSLLLAALWRWGMVRFFSPDAFPGRTAKLFFSYPSPTAATAALCLLLLHVRVKLRARLDRLCEKISAAALGVFLLHTTVWGWLIAPNAALLSPLPQKWVWVNVLLSSLLITAICIPVDLLRARLFALLGVGRLAKVIESRVFDRL